MRLGMMMGVKLGFGNSKDGDEEEDEVKDGDEVGYGNEFGDSEDGDEKEDDIWDGNEEMRLEIGMRAEMSLGM